MAVFHSHSQFVEPINFSNQKFLLKQGIWAYFLLLIFEGAMRKWLLPGLSTPLLVIRDPLAFWLLVMAKKRGLFSLNGYVFGMGLIGIVGTYTAVFLGHGNLAVAIYGARILLFHFPLMFVIGSVFDRRDVVQIGKVTLWLAIPMTVLIVLQFYSSQSAWVNRGVGGDLEGAGFSGALGYFRPPGTFSFTTGNSLFFGLVAPFIFYFWFYAKTINRFILVAATVSLIVAIPFSISRSLFFMIIISMIFTVIAVSRKPKYLVYMILAVAGVIISLAILSNINFFQTASEVFLARFDSASESEGGLKGTLGDRYLGGMIGAITGSSELPFFGYGIGMGSNVGSMLLSGRQTFLLAEEEWARTIGELGLLMGLLVIFLRLGLSMKVAVACYHKLRMGDLLPWILLSFGLMIIPQGQWAQPTTLGFSVMIGGFILASLKLER